MRLLKHRQSCKSAVRGGGSIQRSGERIFLQAKHLAAEWGCACITKKIEKLALSNSTYVLSNGCKGPNLEGKKQISRHRRPGAPLVLTLTHGQRGKVESHL